MVVHEGPCRLYQKSHLNSQQLHCLRLPGRHLSRASMAPDEIDSFDLIGGASQPAEGVRDGSTIWAHRDGERSTGEA